MSFYWGEYIVTITPFGVFCLGNAVGAIVAAVSIALYEKFNEVRRSI